MKVLPWLAAAAAMVVSVATSVVIMPSCMMQQPDEDTIEVSDVAVVEEEPAAIKVEPRVFTWREVGDRITGGVPEEWPEFGETVLWDTSTSLLAYTGQKNSDPILLSDDVVNLVRTIVNMQPLFLQGYPDSPWGGGVDRALAIAWDIYSEVAVNAGTCEEDGSEQVPDVNPFLLAAMGRRESNFVDVTERGWTGSEKNKNYECRQCHGSRGEKGMFQLMPRGAAERLMGEGCDPFERSCNVRGAVRYLSQVRCDCVRIHGTKCNVDTFMAAYGAKSMPTPENARYYKSVINAYRFLCDAVEDCEEYWPRDYDDDFALSL